MQLFFRTALALAGMMMTSIVSHAAELTITTEFKPSATNPYNNKFTNTTVESGFCQRYASKCPADTFSIVTGITATNKTLQANSSDIRDHTYQKMNGTWRTVTLADPLSRRTIEVEFRLALLSQKFDRTSGSWKNDGTDFVVAGSAPVGNCTGTAGYVTSYSYEFAWIYPTSREECYKNVRNLDYDDVKINDISIGYEIRSKQAPMLLPNGNFKGAVDLIVGTGGDIDLGNTTYSDNLLTIKIQSIVQHDFKAEMKGSNKIALQPKGGWQSVINNSNNYVELNGSGKFNITASHPFMMSLECQYSQLGECTLQKDGSTEQVPVIVTTTIPGMMDYTSREMVQDKKLTLTSSNSVSFIIDPLTYIREMESEVKFKISEIESRKMLTQPGSVWRGGATLIFDADLVMPTP